MTTKEIPLFEEKQYLGYNKYSVFRRLGLAGICFAYYYWNLTKGQSLEWFLVLGITILLICVVLFFVLHLHTKVFKDHIILDGFWTTRKVKIDLGSIVDQGIVKYNSFYFNNPVYNLHLKGTIRFYTMGEKAIKLTDKDGLVYLIGTQKPDQFSNILSTVVKSESQPIT